MVASKYKLEKSPNPNQIKAYNLRCRSGYKQVEYMHKQTQTPQICTCRRRQVSIDVLSQYKPPEEWYNVYERLLQEAIKLKQEPSNIKYRTSIKIEMLLN